SWDTDNDGQLDGWECANGTNPRDPASKSPNATCSPSTGAPIGPPSGGHWLSGDTDDDGLLDAWELCHWGTDPTLADTDGDGRNDCREAADMDGSGIANIADVTAVAKAALLSATEFGKDWVFDFDGNGSINIGDAVIVAQLALTFQICKETT
ncbi:MAG: hypothetical protein WEC75_15010, partial [Dehalococcoidia bacterium]